MVEGWDATNEPTARDYICHHMPPGEERCAALWRMGLEPGLEDHQPVRVDAARVARDVRRQVRAHQMGLAVVRRLVSVAAWAVGRRSDGRQD